MPSDRTLRTDPVDVPIPERALRAPVTHWSRALSEIQQAQAAFFIPNREVRARKWTGNRAISGIFVTVSH
jgi:hypothetical protein